MSTIGDRTKDNIEFCETLAQIYEGKGYRVNCTLYPELDGNCGGLFYFADPESVDETRKSPQIYRALRRPDGDAEDVQSNRQRLLREAEDYPSLIEFRRGNVLRHVEKLREMSAAADLPDDFLNPVLEWVERLKTTMLPPPSSSAQENGDSLFF